MGGSRFRRRMIVEQYRSRRTGDVGINADERLVSAQNGRNNVVIVRIAMHQKGIDRGIIHRGNRLLRVFGRNDHDINPVTRTFAPDPAQQFNRHRIGKGIFKIIGKHNAKRPGLTRAQHPGHDMRPAIAKILGRSKNAVADFAADKIRFAKRIGRRSLRNPGRLGDIQKFYALCSHCDLLSQSVRF